MKEYKIKKQTHKIMSGLSFSFQGVVKVDYPQAWISIDVHVSGCKDYRYELHLDPQQDRWSDQDTHKWSVVKYPITIKLDIDKKSLRAVNAAVLGKNNKVMWSDKFDITEDYRRRKVKIYAQPAFIDPIKANADHTYAVGYSGKERTYLWPCGGDHDAKERRLIGTGEAYHPECDCLSQIRTDPAHLGLAGIVYGVDGVCHQATNRIMCTARLEVTDAKGYKEHEGWKNLTYLLYGRLGIRNQRSKNKWERIKANCLVERHIFCAEDETIGETLSQFDGLSGTQIADVEKGSEELQQSMTETYQAFYQGKFTPTDYANRLNERIDTFKSQLSTMWGQKQQKIIFGSLADQPTTIVMPEIAEKVFREGVPELVEEY